MRLIDADAMMERLKSWDTNDAIDKALYNFALSRVLEAPTVKPERKTGRWILSDTQWQEDVDNGNYQFICSECGKADIHSKAVVVSFCWNCGARMEGEG